MGRVTSMVWRCDALRCEVVRLCMHFVLVVRTSDLPYHLYGKGRKNQGTQQGTPLACLVNFADFKPGLPRLLEIPDHFSNTLEEQESVGKVVRIF